MSISDTTTKKMKVVWLCYFTNPDVQGSLKPFKKVDEIAPWINNLIPLFEHNETIDLHIISQHEWIPWYKSFKKNGITYHFLNKGIPLLGRHWPVIFKFDNYTNDYLFKKQTARIVKRINPDIIHLHGAENEFSSSITQFHGKYPVFITIQGFVHKSSAMGKVINKRKKKELEIIKLFKHFGYRTETMGRDIKQLNPNAILHWHGYPMKIISPIQVEKKYDLVFFARMTKDKGIEDLLKAMVILKKVKPDISLCAIGGGNIEEFKLLADSLGIKENVYWSGFLPTQEAVHRLASAARVSVLPTYHDIISGTIVESLLLGVPVVAYNVGSIHEVNSREEIISLVEKLDVDGLAKAISELLNNKGLQKEKAEKGTQRAIEMFVTSNDRIRNDILKAYKEVIEDL